MLGCPPGEGSPQSRTPWRKPARVALWLDRGVGAGQQLHPLLCGNAGEWQLGRGATAFYSNVVESSHDILDKTDIRTDMWLGSGHGVVECIVGEGVCSLRSVTASVLESVARRRVFPL